MPRSAKILIAIAVPLLLMLCYWIYARLTADSLELLLSSDEPLALRIALEDSNAAGEDELAALAQIVIFPEYKRVLFYFVNTDAHATDDDSPLKKESARSADFFEILTGLDSKYSISIHRKQAAHAINLMGGLTLFLEEPYKFDSQKFSYPQGVRFMPGEQAMEFALSRITSQPDRDYLTGVDRLLRLESLLLNLLWIRSELAESVATPEVRGILKKKIKTSLTEEELTTLMEYLLDEDTEYGMMEVPLQIKHQGRKKWLEIKPRSGHSLFTSYKEDLKGGQLRSDNFPVEVLNGTETPGLARRVKQFLQDRGLQVLDADNYAHKPHPNSVLVERSGDTFRANHLYKITGIEKKRVVFHRGYLDVYGSFIIGNDFTTRQLKQ